jgi:DNA polymerase III epsilon subunit-like protein
MKPTLEVMPWLIKTAIKDLEEHLDQIYSSLDEHTQILNKKFDPDNHTTLPQDYFELLLSRNLDNFKISIMETVKLKGYDKTFTMRNVQPIKKAVMLNKESDSLLDMVRLENISYYLQGFPQLAFLDIETDSVNIDTANILQVAIIKPVLDSNHTSLNHLETFNQYILPHPKYKQKDNLAYHVNKIGDKELSMAKPMSLVSDTISSFISNTIIVGYNSNKFDIPILKRHLEANNAQMFHRLSLDLYPACWKNSKQNLSSALEAHNETNFKPHDAASDASCCIELLTALLKKYMIPSNEEELICLFKQPRNTWKNNLKVVEINPNFPLVERPNFKRRHSQISTTSTTESSPPPTAGSSFINTDISNSTSTAESSSDNTSHISSW